MDFKIFERIKFSDWFDGIYFGLCFSGLEVIFFSFIVVVNYFLFGWDNSENVLALFLFVSNILLFVFLKKFKIIKYSVWNEISHKNK